MEYFEYIEEQADIKRREDRQEKKDRFLPVTPPTREGYCVERVDVVKAIQIAIASMLMCATVQAGQPEFAWSQILGSPFSIQCLPAGAVWQDNVSRAIHW